MTPQERLFIKTQLPGLHKGFLYHATDIENGIKILQEGKIKGNTEHPPYGKGVSCTRDFNYARLRGAGGVIFQLNWDLLAKRCKIIPINYFNNRKNVSESEEFVLKQIYPLYDYLMAIMMDGRGRAYCSGMYGEDPWENAQYRELLQHPKLKIIETRY